MMSDKMNVRVVDTSQFMVVCRTEFVVLVDTKNRFEFEVEVAFMYWCTVIFKIRIGYSNIMASSIIATYPKLPMADVMMIPVAALRVAQVVPPDYTSVVEI